MSKRPDSLPETVPSARYQRVRIGLIAAITVIVVIVVVIAGLFGSGLVKVSPGSSTTTHTVYLVGQSRLAIGARDSNATPIPFIVPSGASDAALSGWVNVTACAGGTCGVDVWVVTPLEWENVLSNYTLLGVATVVWCPQFVFCSPIQHTDVNVSANWLAPYDGTILDLAIFSPVSTHSQTVSAYVDLVFTA